MADKRKAARGKRQTVELGGAPVAAIVIEGESQADAVTTEAVVVVLPADCRIAAQVALKIVLIDALAANKVVLDGRGVEQADTAALQLLTLFQREKEVRGGTLEWHGTSEVLNNAAALLGLSQTLDLPAATLA